MELMNDKFRDILLKLQSELSSRLLSIHTRINDNTKKTLEYLY